MLLSHASTQMAADRTGNLTQFDESLAPTAEGPAGHVPWFTDLGGIDHLFRDPVISFQHVVSVPLEVATTSRQGPHGGLVPGYLQHVATVAKADGEELLQGSLHGISEVAPASSFVASVRHVLDRIRVVVLGG
jgi:hypothetical protein